MVLVFMVIIALGVWAYGISKTTDEKEPLGTVVQSIKGCYAATLSKDVYTINIASQTGENFSGTLSFKNFEKDSSSGSYAGTYKNEILLGTYSFESEGMHSEMDVVFKKTKDGFVRGFGDMNTTGEKFVDVGKITYDSTYTFRPISCE